MTEKHPFLPKIEAALARLAVKKKVRFNENGRKVTVVRKGENAFFLILGGHEITTLAEAADAADFVAALLFN